MNKKQPVGFGILEEKIREKDISKKPSMRMLLTLAASMCVDYSGKNNPEEYDLFGSIGYEIYLPDYILPDCDIIICGPGAPSPDQAKKYMCCLEGYD